MRTLVFGILGAAGITTVISGYGNGYDTFLLIVSVIALIVAAESEKEKNNE